MRPDDCMATFNFSKPVKLKTIWFASLVTRCQANNSSIN